MKLFRPEIFHEIFQINFKKIHDVFSAFTLTRLTFLYTSNITFHSFNILQLPKPVCRPSCLVCLFKSFHTIDDDDGDRYRNILPDEGLCRLYYV